MGDRSRRCAQAIRARFPRPCAHRYRELWLPLQPQMGLAAHGRIADGEWFGDETPLSLCVGVAQRVGSSTERWESVGLSEGTCDAARGFASALPLGQLVYPGRLSHFYPAFWASCHRWRVQHADCASLLLLQLLLTPDLCRLVRRLSRHRHPPRVQAPLRHLGPASAPLLGRICDRFLVSTSAIIAALCCQLAWAGYPTTSCRGPHTTDRALPSHCAQTTL